MTRVVLGNRNAIHSHDDGETVERLKGKRATLVQIDAERSALQILNAILKPADGVWANHAVEGSKPAWVASDDANVAGMLADHFGGLEVRNLLNPYDPATAGKPGSTTLSIGLPTLMLPSLTVLALATFLLRTSPFLRTNVGADFQATQMAGSATATAVAKWMAITANATAESVTDTTLTGEIATAGGGLIRQLAVYAHTTGASSYTLTGTFTANGSDALPVTANKMAIFTQLAVGGTMVFEKLLTGTNTFSNSGDSMVITQTVTI